ncbi:ribosomal protein S5-alanine N-acetyltransferase [Acidimangrovimonas pyrenivorans]|uniref:Ribosomal protein S5-alanine N-acetyltransferase n=1 Tax=Acidimangrovimonas pyrenivorans TaxID=2030798 RepID=A0ABV7AJ99_9RHOB
MITTDRTTLCSVSEDDALALRDYYLRNADHLRPWEPRRPDGYHALSEWRVRALQFAEEAAEGRAYRFVARLRGESDILAIVNFNNVVRGAFQACHLGYSIDARHQGQGLMHEMLSAAISHVFLVHRLHRVMANYLPENSRSAQLLERLGFEIEGRARDYLWINGCWRDHVLTSRINPGMEV